MVNEQFTIVNITHLLEREPNLGLNIPFLDPNSHTLIRIEVRKNIERFYE
jgi:hypothetical protein